jgi:predicted secreted protein
MQIGSYIAIYFVLWWLCLFMVLPFGVRNQVDVGTIVRGTDPGAPIFLRLWQRLLATSVLAGILMALLLWGLSSTWLQQYWR